MIKRRCQQQKYDQKQQAVNHWGQVDFERLNSRFSKAHITLFNLLNTHVLNGLLWPVERSHILRSNSDTII